MTFIQIGTRRRPLRPEMCLAIIAAFFGTFGWSARADEIGPHMPPAPTQEAYQLARDSATRSLLPEEVALVYGNPLSAIFFLETTIRSRLTSGPTQTLPAGPPQDRCLADALHDVAIFAEDGAVSPAEWEQVWNLNGKVAGYAYEIATDGGEPSLYTAKFVSRGFARRPPSRVEEWYWSKARESQPVSAPELARALVWNSSMKERATARLMQLGQPARDELVAMMNVDHSIDALGSGRNYRTQFVALYVLGAVGDSRLGALQFPALTSAAEIKYLAAVRSNLGALNPSVYDFAGFLYRSSQCGHRSVDARTGRSWGKSVPGISPRTYAD